MSISSSFGYSLQRGWNLISPTLAKEIPVEEFVQQNLSGTVGKIWSFEAEWKFYEPGNADSSLTHIRPALGYWVLMLGKGHLFEDTGVNDFAKVEIQPGWNLVGFSAHENLSLDKQVYHKDAIEGAKSALGKSWTYHNSAWKSFHPLDEDKDLELEPGQGLWVLGTGIDGSGTVPVKPVPYTAPEEGEIKQSLLRVQPRSQFNFSTTKFVEVKAQLRGGNGELLKGAVITLESPYGQQLVRKITGQDGLVEFSHRVPNHFRWLALRTNSLGGSSYLKFDVEQQSRIEIGMNGGQK